MARNYSSVAEPKTLSGNVTSTATQITLNNIDGLPSPPYVLVLNPDTASEEVVLVNANQTGAVAPTLNVTRAIEASGSLGLAKTHTSGNTVKHMIVGSDLQLVHDHIDSTSAHDATGGVVGLTKAQALTNKTINLASNIVTGTKAQFNTAISDADFATLTGTEELTNKTLTSPTINNPTISGAVIASANIVDGTIVNADISASANIGATKINGTITEFNTALQGADFATLAGTESLSNKTLASPTITGSVVGIGVISSGNLVNGTILDEDIHPSANIAKSKIIGTAISAADTGTVTSTMILDDTIVDADINTNAAITQSKIAGMGAWTSFTPTLTSWGVGNGVWDSFYTQIGKTIIWRCKFTAGSTTTFAGSPTLTLPWNAKSATLNQPFVVNLGAGGTISMGIGYIATTSTVNFVAQNSAGTYLTNATISATVPGTWANSNVLSFVAIYEI